jgi:hypothetical protein
MMQEHRQLIKEHRPRQASQHGRQRTAGQGQPKLFEFSFKMMRQCINEPFMKAPLYIIWTLSL